MGSIDIQAYSDALNRINQSPVLDKIFNSDSVEIDRNGFCRYFCFHNDIFDEAKDQLGSVVSFSAGTLEDDEEPNSVDDILDEIVFEASFIDDDYDRFEYYISIKQLLDAEILEDGSIKIIKEDSENDELILTFYRLTIV